MWLGIDTSGAVAVAVGRPVGDGDRPSGVEVLARGADVRARHHDEVLLGLIDRTLAEAGVTRGELTVVVAGRGPGPFTGLRVGLVVARTIAAVLDVPLLGVCSLDALAHQAAAAAAGGTDAGRSILVALDARRQEVYWAEYTTGAALVRTSGPSVARPAEVAAAAASADAIVGSGAQLYPDLVPPTPALADVVHVDAGDLLQVAAQHRSAGEDLTVTDPLYLREPDAKRPTRRKSALGA
jgi:tRNA threonylcarbamoyl adenosine modification protein YeaZ